MRHLLFAALLLAACTPVRVDELPQGRFSGEVVVVWVAEDRFVYAPVPGNGLRFRRADGTVVEPDMMYTDGGSIPRLVQLFDGFSPWGYGPVYVVHDWLFVARACAGEQADNPRVTGALALDFRDSFIIVGEMIRTLEETQIVPRRDFSPTAITSAVGGPISRRAWNQPGSCASRWVSDAHRARVDALLFPSARRILPDGEPPARIVRRIGFD